jgi:hypothetical protein
MGDTYPRSLSGPFMLAVTFSTLMLSVLVAASGTEPVQRSARVLAMMTSLSRLTVPLGRVPHRRHKRTLIV